MDCKTSYEELAAFAAGDAEHLGRHVRACAACRERLAVLERVDRDLRLLPRPEPSAGAVLAARRQHGRHAAPPGRRS